MNLTSSDITFNNVNFDLPKHSDFKDMLKLLNVCLILKESPKKIFHFIDLAFELVAVNSHYNEENTCHRWSVC